MAKTKSLTLAERLVVSAHGNIAHSLRPFPDEAVPEELTAAIAALRARGLVQGMEREPNLTRAGVEFAEKLLAGRTKKKGDDKGDAPPSTSEGEGEGDGDGEGDSEGGEGTQP